MNYCPRCGTPLSVGQNFCGNCGLDVREPKSEQAQFQPAALVRGLGRNNLVFFTFDGLHGVRLRSGLTLVLAVLLPLPLLALVYYFVQVGSLAVYIAVWVATAGLLYDELRWRRVRSLQAYSPSNSTASGHWMIRWSSIRMADWNGRTLWLSSADPARKLSVTFDREEAPSVERSLDSWGIRYSWKKSRLPPRFTTFLVLTLLLFAVSQVVLILAATLPFFPGEEQMYNTILNGTETQVTGATFLGAFKAIYLNNIQVAWGGMLPVLGQISFGLASYNTGRVIQVIAISRAEPTSFVLVVLYLFPHTWIEESAYPIATVAGFLGVTRWRSVSPGEFARRPNWGSSKFALAMGGVALILFVAGLIETTGLYIGFGELLFWVPLVIGYYLLVERSRAHKREMAQSSDGAPSTLPGTPQL